MNLSLLVVLSQILPLESTQDALWFHAIDNSLLLFFRFHAFVDREYAQKWLTVSHTQGNLSFSSPQLRSLLRKAYSLNHWFPIVSAGWLRFSLHHNFPFAGWWSLGHYIADPEFILPFLIIFTAFLRFLPSCKHFGSFDGTKFVPVHHFCWRFLPFQREFVGAFYYSIEKLQPNNYSHLSFYYSRPSLRALSSPAQSSSHSSLTHKILFLYFSPLPHPNAFNSLHSIRWSFVQGT